MLYSLTLRAFCLRARCAVRACAGWTGSFRCGWDGLCVRAHCWTLPCAVCCRFHILFPAPSGCYWLDGRTCAARHLSLVFSSVNIISVNERLFAHARRYQQRARARTQLAPMARAATRRHTLRYNSPRQRALFYSSPPLHYMNWEDPNWNLGGGTCTAAAACTHNIVAAPAHIHVIVLVRPLFLLNATTPLYRPPPLHEPHNSLFIVCMPVPSLPPSV